MICLYNTVRDQSQAAVMMFCVLSTLLAFPAWCLWDVNVQIDKDSGQEGGCRNLLLTALAVPPLGSGMPLFTWYP
jgi:hypothetical protein